MGRLKESLWGDLVGLPYKYRGRGPEYYDCYGLLLEVNRRRGIIIPDVFYGPTHEEQAYNLSNPNKLGWIKALGLPGDTVCFKNMSGVPAHCGIMIDEDDFIHATEDYQQVLLSKLSRGYGRRIVGFYKYAV